MHKAFAKPVQVEHRSRKELNSRTGGHLLDGRTALLETGPPTATVEIQRVASFNEDSTSEIFSKDMNSEACDDDTILSDPEFPPTAAATQTSIQKNHPISHEPLPSGTQESTLVTVSAGDQESNPSDA